MITYFSNDVALLSNRKADYLPKWAKDEGLFNCENSWVGILKGLFIKYISDTRA